MLFGVITQSPNPILPATGEIVWSVISFAILLVVLGKVAFPPVSRMMAKRSEAIRSDLEEAERAKREAELLRHEASQRLEGARDEAHRILEEAREVGESLRAEALTRAHDEANQIVMAARASLSAERSRLVAELRAETTGLALDLAQRIIASEIDRAQVDPLIEQFIAEGS